MALLCEEGSPGVVFCTHGEVLERFYFALGSDLLHIDGPTAQILAKGVAWRLTTRSGGVTLAIHPPTTVAPGAQGLLTASEAAVASLDSDRLAVLRCLPTGWSLDDIAKATGLPRDEVEARVADFCLSLGVTDRVVAVERPSNSGCYPTEGCHSRSSLGLVSFSRQFRQSTSVPRSRYAIFPVEGCSAPELIAGLIESHFAAGPLAASSGPRSVVEILDIGLRRWLVKAPGARRTAPE